MSDRVPSNGGCGVSARSQRLMSQMLSTLIPTSTEDILRKYPALLDVPFISLAEILVTREIGSGSFGRVYHGIFSFQDVAVKKLTVRNFRDEIDLYDKLFEEDYTPDADKKARQAAETLLALEKEVSMLKRISFPKVVGFYGVCFEPAAIVSEYCARGSLFDLIARARVSTRVACELSWERRLSLANDAAIGMNFLHNRHDPIIHRDLKSPNLLVDEHYNCKVADFNTAGFVNATEISKSQANNPRWLAPEIADGKPHTKASDVYPFGIILWELLTWLRPFEFDGEEMTTYNILLGIVRDKVRPEIPPNEDLLGGSCPVYEEYIELMQECWDQNPENRPNFAETHARLQLMIKKTESLKNAQPSSPRPSASVPVRTARQTSPEPGISRSPRSESPFSRRRLLTEAVSNRTDAATNNSMKPSETVPESDTGSEQCLTSPFQNGPPSLGVKSVAVKSREIKILENPPSFANWSVRGDQNSPPPQDLAFAYSDVVQNHPVAEKKSKGAELWATVREQLGLEDLLPSRTKDRGALHKWDSLRTTIFGDPNSEQFQEQFASFLKGDETAELKRRLESVDARGSPGLRILRALMELRDDRMREETPEPVAEEKPTGWCLVKHLMLINLPTPVHPMWEMLSESIRPRYSADSAAEQPNGHGGVDPKRERAQKRWKLVRDLFLDADFRPSQPMMHPGWRRVWNLFFADDEETTSSPSPRSRAPDPIPQPSTSSAPPREPKKSSHWTKVRRALLSNVVEDNWDYLTEYARSSVMKKKAETPAGKIRKIAIVDEEPPTADKWQVVRSLLMQDDLGEEWNALREKARRIVDPPRGTEWEIFRWLFFENRKLRNQSLWTFIKDLFLKTLSPTNTSSLESDL